MFLCDWIAPLNFLTVYSPLLFDSTDSVRYIVHSSRVLEPGVRVPDVSITMVASCYDTLTV